MSGERRPHEIGISRYNVEPGLSFLRMAAGRTFDVVTSAVGPKKKFIVRASRRGYVRVYVNHPIRKSLMSIFSGADIQVDLLNRQIAYKQDFLDLAHSLQKAYNNSDNVRDNERGVEYSLRFFSVGEM